MTIKELKEQLSRYDENLETTCSYTTNSCRGHNEGEYCYCPDEEIEKSISYLTLDKVKKNQIVTLHLEY